MVPVRHGSAYPGVISLTLDKAHDMTQRMFLMGMDIDGTDHASRKASAIGNIVTGAQLHVGHYTSAYLADQLGVEPRPANLGITKRDTGIPKGVLYQRPFRIYDKSRDEGQDHATALAKAQRRLKSLVGVDIQMAKVRQAQRSLRAAGAETYLREPTGDELNCELCQGDSQRVHDVSELMPIHVGCTCNVIADLPGHPLHGRMPESPAAHGISVQRHGEIGPVLLKPGEQFVRPNRLPPI